MKCILYLFLLCSPLFSFAQHPEIPDNPENLQQHLLDIYNAANLLNMGVTVLDSTKTYFVQPGMDILIASNNNSYNNQAKPLKQDYFLLDLNANKHYLSTAIEYIYTPFNEYTLISYLRSNLASPLLPTIRETYRYDPQEEEKLVNYYRQSWNTVENNFFPDFEETLVKETTNLQEWDVYRWNSTDTSMVTRQKKIIENYNTESRITEIYDYDPQTGNQMPVSRILYSDYNEGRNILFIKNYLWNENLDDWELDFSFEEFRVPGADFAYRLLHLRINNNPASLIDSTVVYYGTDDLRDIDSSFQVDIITGELRLVSGNIYQYEGYLLKRMENYSFTDDNLAKRSETQYFYSTIDIVSSTTAPTSWPFILQVENPTNEIIVQLQGQVSAEDISLELYDLNGQLLESTLAQLGQSYHLGGPQLAAGFYLLKLRYGEEQYVHKLIKQ